MKTGRHQSILSCVLVALSLLGVEADSADAQEVNLPRTRSFHMQFQELDIDEAARSPFTILITDYALDGAELTELSTADVAQLRAGGQRIVLAYLTIGEAESYRFYWDPNWVVADGNSKNKKDEPEGGGIPAPDWVGPADGVFGDNFKARFWDPAWKEIVVEYLDRILAQGFDGIFLDRVDVFEYWGPEGVNERPTAEPEMLDFVLELISYARAVDPGFYVVTANGLPLVDRPEYVSAISGLFIEDAWFDDNKPQKKDYTDYVIAQADVITAAGKAVLATDYPTNDKKILEFYERAWASGYAAYHSTRELDSMTVLPEVHWRGDPVLALNSVGDGGAVSREDAPVFTWQDEDAIDETVYELRFAASRDLRKTKRIPSKKKRFIEDVAVELTARDWRRIVKSSKKGRGDELYWWVMAIEPDGTRQVTDMRLLSLDE